MVFSVFCDLYRFSKTSVIMGGHPNIDGQFMKSARPESFSLVILHTQRHKLAGKYNSKFIKLRTQSKALSYRFQIAQKSWVDKNGRIYKC